ncbi:MAG: peroxidase family protein [Saprospiraceae bacterium]|nr:T9SS type A sorting domain-containing protein [Lewinella sp.]
MNVYLMKTYTRYRFVLLIAIVVGQTLQGQEFRTFNGFYNNLDHPEYGGAGTLLPAVGTIGFGDNISSPAGADRPNPRLISNTLFQQNTLADDVRGLSAYTWAWGQFIDHDITLSEDHPVEKLDIAVPMFDAFFDPDGSGDVVIPMHRSAYAPFTGTSTDNPRRYINGITAFIDASGVYGSDMDRSLWLRSFENGKMRVSAGNLLPFNTTTGELADPVSLQAPPMAMPIPFVKKWFVAGDVRANENPFLTAIHTLFVREHNRLCDQLKAAHPDWTDEMLFQQARKLVGGLLQAIVYEEWLPALGVHLAPYSGYDSTVDPGILNVFNTAAYRYGHTTINSLLVRMDNDGNDHPMGDILLRDAYFNPGATTEVGGIDCYLMGMSTVVEQDFDCKVIDDLRNFLFGPPGAGGLDLVAMNINRGRDRGLPDYNTVRADLGLSLLTSFSEFTSDPLMNQSLEFIYKGKINSIDPWVGMLAENHMPDALFGLTAMTIIKQQFSALRRGDRFYYENDPDLSAEEKEWIKQTRLADVIRRNTSITIIQDEIFFIGPILSPVAEPATAAQIQFKVHPNPATDLVTLRITATEHHRASIQLTDARGKVVMERKETLSSGHNTLFFNLPPDCAPGMYLLSIWDGKKLGHQRLLII